MSQALDRRLEGMAGAARELRGVFLMDRDGVVVERSAATQPDEAERVAAEYALILREVEALAADRGWGAMRSFGVSGAADRVAFGPWEAELLLGLTGAAAALPGELRRVVSAGPARTPRT